MAGAGSCCAIFQIKVHRRASPSDRRTGVLSLILHSVSDSPDDDLPPGKRIVWGDEAKPPVFGHWPTALLYGPRGGDGSAAREFFVLAIHHYSWSLALARSQYRRGSGYAGSGLWRSWHRLGCRMGAKTHNPKGLRLNLSEFARRATPKLNLSGLRLA
jgi:hypothetical protein